MSEKLKKNLITSIVIAVMVLIIVIIAILIYKSNKENASKNNVNESLNENTEKRVTIGTDVTNQVKVDTETIYDTIDEVLNYTSNMTTNNVATTNSTETQQTATDITTGISVGTDDKNQQCKIVAENLGWKILKDNGNTVDLIAINSTDLKIVVSKAAGYNNGVKALNEICKSLYGNATVNGTKVLSARNVNFEDFYADSREYAESSYETNNIYPIILESDNSDYKTGWSAQGSYYILPKSQQSKASQGKLTIKSNYFEGEPNINVRMASTGKQYWLASRCIYAGVETSNYGLRTINESGRISYWPMYSSDGKVASPSIGFRPIIRVAKEALTM